MTGRDVAAVTVLLVLAAVAIVQAWTVPSTGSGALLLVGLGVIIAALISESGQEAPHE